MRNMSVIFPNPVDVVIVGGGPTGLATAIAARQHGLNVLVADGAKPPIDKPCGEGLMPDGVEALRRLGVNLPASDVQPFRGIRFVNGQQVAEATFPQGTAYGIRRTVLHQLLIDHAAHAGASLLWHAPVTGLHREGVLVAGELVRTRWIVGADGTASRVRRWANLDAYSCKSVRFASRRHYRVTPWTDFMELHWGQRTQIYVTRVGSEEVCVAVISDGPKVQLDDALAEFPELATRLRHAEFTSSERGAITASRKLRRVYRGNTVLVGDASAGIDAITGEGLCLGFRQSVLLAECLASGDLARYQVEHRRLVLRPALMARFMLFMGNHDRLRHRTMRVFQSSPRSFAGMLSMHVGVGSARDYVSNGIFLGWELLKA
jgi:2-polyprenyl-6-methoxyphenol hydroxylase-like FAD-dependent oxidoreductase